MKVRFWGTRGSLAKPGPSTVRYGGNTSCVEVRSAAGTRIVIDCGTGGHDLGQAIMREGVPSRGFMLISHTHWDHIQGIPFFTPFFVPGHKWDLYAPQGFGNSLKDALAGQMEYTYFPVTPEAFGAEVRYHNLGEGRFVINDVSIETRYLNHPALTLAFRITADGATIVYACDHEPHARELATGGATLENEDLAHARFMAGADLVIHDAQYLATEYDAKRGWGHSTVEYAVAVARAAGARRIALTHHDPLRHDDAIDAAVARLRAGALPGDPEILAAAEGLEIDVVGQPSAVRPTGETRAAILPDAATGTAHVVLVSADDRTVGRIAPAIASEQAILVTVSDVGEASERGADAALVLVDDGFPDWEAVVAALPRADAGQRPVVLLGGSGPCGPAAVDRLEDPWSPEYARARIRAWLMRADFQWVRAAVSGDEAARLSSLRGLDILDTPPEERFDRLTRLAAALFDVPMALVSLVDADRQWFKSRVGTEVCETSRDTSFCAHAVAARDMLVVRDTLADARFRDNPLVAGPPHIRFYAGAPLHGADGHLVGTICILDILPRDVSDAQRALLADIATMIDAELLRSSVTIAA